MKKMIFSVLAILLIASLSYAEVGDKPKATEPIGAVIETTGFIVGRITNVIEKSLGGGKKEGSLILADDNGKTKVIPLDETVKVVDTTFHGLTLNQLNKGEKVKVELFKDTKGQEKAKTVTKVK